MKNSEDHHFKKSYWLVTIIPVFSFIMLIFGGFAKINANEVGIIYNDMNGIQDVTMKEGFHSKSIFDHVISIKTSNRSANIETYSQTSDGQSAQFEISIIYNITAADAGKFFRKANSNDIKSEQLNTLIKQTLQASTSVYNIFDLLSEGLEKVRSSFETNLKASLYNEFYITLSRTSFDDIDAGDEVEAILKKKAEADQEIEIAKKEAEAANIKAASDAQVQKTLADAEAYATTVKGKATGDAASAYIRSIQYMINRLYCSINSIPDANITFDSNGDITTFIPIASSAEVMSYEKCSTLILNIIFYNTWDGKLPEVLTNDSLSALIGKLITNSSSGSSSGTTNP